ncbi:hypothetical protein DEU31_1892 [Brachybacterium sp. AG952]|uniref:hypothetical protein n=1 Tax=Brachybacterium sp. AG952 TaxID=2183989 RepID=UPI0010D19A73|nr:hypothetical protein [Brachybacterium sp. AG952]TDP78438.1 hypothetical protein DEU31_1892 [Brachybacterium sp. AG952]
MKTGKNEGRPAANGTASTRQDTGHELASDSTAGVPVLALPSPVDVSRLDPVERAWTGGLLCASADVARDATDALFRGALADERLAVVARAVWRVSGAGERPSWTSVGEAARGMVRPADHGRFLALLVDLSDVTSAPRGAGELIAQWPALVDHAARRAAGVALERLRHAIDDQVDGDLLAAGLREAAEDLTEAAAQLDLAGVVA